MPDPRDTPAMRQHARFKQRHPDCILLFRIGDFYEMFDDDAVAVSKALGLTLTQRTEGVPMAGVPYHQLEVYLRRLIGQGFRVAVCEQVQEARESKGVIDRAVTRVLTPGTLVDESLLEDAAPNVLAAVAFPPMLSGCANAAIGAATVELSTGDFAIFDCSGDTLADELARRAVSEVLYPEQEGGPPAPVAAAAAAIGVSCTPRPAWHFRGAESLEALCSHYGVAGVEGFGLLPDDAALPAAGAVIRYVRETQPGSGGGPSHIGPPRRDDPRGHCILDAVSLRALEVERTIRPPRMPGAGGPGAGGRGTGDGSLVGLFLPGCRTPMGKRLVRQWLCRPLAAPEPIAARHHCVATMVEDRRTARALAECLADVQDIARIAGRLALARATPRDLVGLGRSLERIGPIGETIQNAPAFAAHAAALDRARAALDPLAARILGRCIDSPPAHLRDGGLFREGVDAELDEARLLQRDASGWLAAYQQRLAAEHKLPGIKVGFNRVFGYYIELPAAQSRRAPDAFVRKQTLKNAERYTTPELRDFEEKVTTARARALERERTLFEDLCRRAAAAIAAISDLARAIAELDVLSCFADRAVRRGWVRPEVRDEPILSIGAGRHPVLEEVLGDSLVPNDLELGAPERLALITGPNMAGKSTFIRQTALIVLLAQAGSFVPADSARIGIADRIFTRVGADDALHAGQSTFMVEMTETASILHNAGPRSLVILDEIGRGTSTLDGLSLAWAVVEHLCADPSPRTLFATHYHELTELEDGAGRANGAGGDGRAGGVRNLHVSVREWGDQIVFLHRILPGRSSRSYGLHVARLAGVPPRVVERAGELLGRLRAEQGKGEQAKDAAPPGGAPPGQLPLFTEYLPHPALHALREIKLDAISPMQAFDALRQLKDLADGA